VQLLDRLLGPILVEEAEPDRQAHDDEDDGGVCPLPDHHRDDGRPGQQDEERVPELPQEHLKGSGAVTEDRVRSDCGETERRFFGHQARFG
jgi:hypothetical protein